jgi:hypothetical protein
MMRAHVKTMADAERADTWYGLYLQAQRRIADLEQRAREAWAANHMEQESVAYWKAKAERYQWLRDHAKSIEIITQEQMFACRGGDELDRVIDASRSATNSLEGSK